MSAEWNALTAQALALADTLSGGRGMSPALETLCLAAAQAYAERLKPGLTPHDCAPAYISACACAALAGLTTQQGVAGGFRLGAVSLSSGGGTEARAKALLREAERLMAPYTDDGFAFLGVEG